MKKTIFTALIVVSAMSLPVFASNTTVKIGHERNPLLLSTVGKSLESSMGIEQTLLSSKQDYEAKTLSNRQAFLPSNPYQSYFDQNTCFKSELKIDLENFDMEYVLKIR